MDERPFSSERILRALSQFVRALSHSVRGDLSVINNDLSYFSSLLPDEDVTSSLSRCVSIADALRKLTFAQGEAFQSYPSDIETVMLGSFSPATTVNLVSNEDTEKLVTIDPLITQRALKTIHDTLLAGEDALSLSLERSTDASLLVRILSSRSAVLDGEEEGEVQSEVQGEDVLQLVDATILVRGEASVPAVALADITLALQSIHCRVLWNSASKRVVGIEYALVT